MYGGKLGIWITVLYYISSNESSKSWEFLQVFWNIICFFSQTFSCSTSRGQRCLNAQTSTTLPLKLCMCILERRLCTYCSLPVLPAQHVTDGTPDYYNTSAHRRSEMSSDHSSDHPSNSCRKCDIKTASVYILAFIIIALSIALSLCLAEVTCSRGDTSLTSCDNTEEELSASLQKTITPDIAEIIVLSQMTEL